jgi:hypothetical protein
MNPYEKAETMTREKFALWSFERDRGVGLYERSVRFENIHAEDKEAYLSEADHYLKLPYHEWPIDIVERLCA